MAATLGPAGDALGAGGRFIAADRLYDHLAGPKG